MIRKSILLQYISATIFITRSATFVVTPRHPRPSAALPLPLRAVAEENLITVLNRFIDDKDRQIERLANQLKEAKEEKDKLIKEKDQRIEEKDQRIEEKDQRIEEKDEWIKKTEEQLVKVAADLSMLRAKYYAGTNLRPLLEFLLRQWYCQQRPNNRFKMTEAFKAFAKEKGEEIYEKFYLEHVVHLMGCDPITPKSGETQKQAFVRLISELYGKLSEDVHTISGLDNLSPDIIGFVVNRDAVFSSVVSAVLMSYHVSHTVMSKDYRSPTYTWGKGIDAQPA